MIKVPVAPWYGFHCFDLTCAVCVIMPRSPKHNMTVFGATLKRGNMKEQRPSWAALRDPGRDSMLILRVCPCASCSQLTNILSSPAVFTDIRPEMKIVRIDSPDTFISLLTLRLSQNR